MNSSTMPPGGKRQGMLPRMKQISCSPPCSWIHAGLLGPQNSPALRKRALHGDKAPIYPVSKVQHWQGASKSMIRTLFSFSRRCRPEVAKESHSPPIIRSTLQAALRPARIAVDAKLVDAVVGPVDRELVAIVASQGPV